MHVVANRFAWDTGGLGDHGADAAYDARHYEMGHIAGRNTGIREQTLEGPGNQFHIPFVADPPFFPVVVEILAFAFVVIDEIDGDLLCAQEFRSARIAADDKGGRAVAIEQFLRCSSFGAPFFSGSVKNFTAAFCELQSIDEAGRTGSLRCRHVHRHQIIAEVQRRRENTCVLAVLEGCRSCCEEQSGEVVWCLTT